MTAAYRHPEGPAIIGRKDDWETPPELFERYNARFGFTLDVCAMPYNRKVERFFSPDDDGLSQDWSGEVCWMNPPYGRAIGTWMKKAWEESLRGATVVCLIPVRSDTAWWHDYAAKGEVELLRGRVSFLGPALKGHNAPFPCATVVFRPTTHNSNHTEP